MLIIQALACDSLMSLATILLMEEILHQLISSLSHYFTGFYTSRWWSPDSLPSTVWNNIIVRYPWQNAPCNSQLSCWLWSFFWSSAFGRRRFSGDSGKMLEFFFNLGDHKLYTFYWVVSIFVFVFSPTYLGKWTNLTNIFQMGWKHQLVYYLLSSTETAKEITWDHQRSGDDVFHECWVI